MSPFCPKLAGLCAVAALAAPVALADPGSKAPLARVSVAECSRGPQALDRSAQFRGVMRQVAGTDTMWMRFALQERQGGGIFEMVRAPGLNVWRKSMSGVKRFVHTQEVLALAEGSEYRARVRFRWYGPGGELVREAARRSGTCSQAGELANLRVAKIGAHPTPASPGVFTYAVQVINRGGATAPGANVGLAVDGAGVDTVTVGSLEPDEERVALLNGPACIDSVRAEVDPAGTVTESSESDNVLSSRCPLKP